MRKRNSKSSPRKTRRNFNRNSIVRGSTRAMPFQQYLDGTATLSAGFSSVTYTINNLFSDLQSNRVVSPTTIMVAFEPIFPTGSTPGTNIIYAQLTYRDPATLTDVPGSRLKLLSQTNSTKLRIRIPQNGTGWYAASNSTIIMSIAIRTSVACSLNYIIDSRAMLAIDNNA